MSVAMLIYTVYFVAVRL